MVLGVPFEVQVPALVLEVQTLCVAEELIHKESDPCFDCVEVVLMVRSYAYSLDLVAFDHLEQLHETYWDLGGKEVDSGLVRKVLDYVGDVAEGPSATELPKAALEMLMAVVAPLETGLAEVAWGMVDAARDSPYYFFRSPGS